MGQVIQYPDGCKFFAGTNAKPYVGVTASLGRQNWVVRSPSLYTAFDELTVQCFATAYWPRNKTEVKAAGDDEL